MAIADSPPALGARVRSLREAMDLSLRDLAERSGVSAPMLSQVERGETSPTLQVATRIAHGLELRLSQLLRLDEQSLVTVVRRGGARGGPPAPPRHPRAAHPGGGGRAPPPMHEPGSRETTLVAGGTVILHCDGATHELH